MRSISRSSLLLLASLLMAAPACSRKLQPPAPATPQTLFLSANQARAGRDDAHALALYREAAGQGYAPALQTLALAYRYGELGLLRDEDEARRYDMEAEDALQHQLPPPRR
jgi:TPR repeat protein